MSHEQRNELVGAHAELERLLQAIELETRKPIPDISSLANVRLKLTQASRRKASIVAELIEVTLRTDQAQKRRLEQLRVDIQKARQASAIHIGKWTTQAIESDWTGYRQASKQIRATMRKLIDQEVAAFRTFRVD